MHVARHTQTDSWLADENWRNTGWANGVTGDETAYTKWRDMTEEEITGRQRFRTCTSKPVPSRGLLATGAAGMTLLGTPRRWHSSWMSAQKTRLWDSLSSPLATQTSRIPGAGHARLERMWSGAIDVTALH